MDGQLDWFAAWLWTMPLHEYLRPTINTRDGIRINVDPGWLDDVDHQARATSVHRRPTAQTAGTTPSNYQCTSMVRCRNLGHTVRRSASVAAATGARCSRPTR